LNVCGQYFRGERGEFMIDAHIHLALYDREYIERDIETWRNNCVSAVVAVATDLKSSYATLELKQRYPGFVYAALGHHPEQALPNEQDLLELVALIGRERALVSAVGEVGLPYYTLNNPSPEAMAPYIDFLRVFMQVARKQALPVVLHAVHQHAQTACDLLHEEDIEQAHFHWLKAERPVVSQIVKAGYYVSLTPEVCYRRRDQVLVQNVPMDCLLLETDGPWPFSGPFKGRATTPLLLPEAAGKVALLKDMTVEEVVEITERNTRRLYGDLR